jgi:hypothetical protein
MAGMLSSLVGKMKGVLGKPSAPSSGGSGDPTDPGSTQVDRDAALKYTTDRWNDLKNSLVVFHQAVWETFLFYANQTWIEWEDSRKIWQPQQPTDDFVPQPRINRFSPSIDAVTSNIYQIPEVEAIPKPMDDPTANMVADIATRLAADFMVRQGLRGQIGSTTDKAGMAAQMFVLAGTVFSFLRLTKKTTSTTQKQAPVPAYSATCPVCDKVTQTPKTSDSNQPVTCPDCGSPLDVSDSEMMQPQTDDQGQPVMDDNAQYEIECEVDGPLYAFPRPGAKSVDDSPYLLWAKRRTLDDIWFRWNFEAQADSEWPDGFSVTYEHALNFWYTGYSSSTIQMKDSCMVLELLVAPNKVRDFPNGMHMVSINQQDAFCVDWDYPENPLTKGGYLDMPTIFFDRSVGFDLVQIQRELNAYESLIKLHAMVSAVDPIVADKATQVSEITGRADKIIWWRSVGPNSEPPHRMGSGHLDDGIYKQRDNLHAEFQNISMAVNAFRGQQEGAITASSAIQQLRSQAELMFSKPVGNWGNFWKETIRKAVLFIQKFYTFSQIATIIGPGREAEIHAFMSADLKSCTDWVSSQHGRQEMMTLWDKKALDINDPAVRSKLYELFGETGMMASFNKDATRARLENVAMKEGKPINPQPAIEDMGIHLYFHKDQAKSLDFDKWPPASKQLLIQHIMATQQAMQQQQMQQQILQDNKATVDAKIQSLATGSPTAGVGPGPDIPDAAPGTPGAPPSLSGGPVKPPVPGGATPSQSQSQGSQGAIAAQGKPAIKPIGGM